MIILDPFGPLVDSDNPSQESFLMELADNPTGLKDCESEVPRGEGSTRMGFEIGLKAEGLVFREYGRLNSRPGFVFDYAAAVFPFGFARQASLAEAKSEK